MQLLFSAAKVPPMQLAAYLKREKIRPAEFARRANLSEGTISLLLRGKVWVSRKTDEKIRRASNGEVTANDFAEAEAAE